MSIFDRLKKTFARHKPPPLPNGWNTTISNVDPWHPDATFLEFSKHSRLTWADAYAHFLIIMATGGGKTLGVIHGLEEAAIRSGASLISLCYKPDDSERILAKCRRYGIEAIHVAPETGHVFDPIAYSVAAGASVSQITKDLIMLARVDKPQTGGGQNDFFLENAEEAFRCAFTILQGAGESVSLSNCREVLNSLPPSPLPDDPKLHTAAHADFFIHSFMGQCITKGIDRNIAGLISAALFRSMDHAVKVLGQEYPTLAPQTKSSILQTAFGLQDKALVCPFDVVGWGGKCSWVPDQLWTGAPRWLVVGYEPTRWGVAGELYQIAIKISLQAAIMRRNVSKYPRAVVFFQDEAQRVLVPSDPDFLAVARSQRCANVFASQSLQIIAKRLHETHPGSASLALTGLAQTHIFGQNSCDYTNEYAAKLFGKKHVWVAEMHGESPSMKEDYRWRIDPSVFSHELQGPSRELPYAMTVIHRSGRVWKETGEPYLLYPWPLGI